MSAQQWSPHPIIFLLPSPATHTATASAREKNLPQPPPRVPLPTLFSSLFSFPARPLPPPPSPLPTHPPSSVPPPDTLSPFPDSSSRRPFPSPAQLLKTYLSSVFSGGGAVAFRPLPCQPQTSPSSTFALLSIGRRRRFPANPPQPSWNSPDRPAHPPPPISLPTSQLASKLPGDELPTIISILPCVQSSSPPSDTFRLANDGERSDKSRCRGYPVLVAELQDDEGGPGLDHPGAFIAMTAGFHWPLRPRPESRARPEVTPADRRHCSTSIWDSSSCDEGDRPWETTVVVDHPATVAEMLQTRRGIALTQITAAPPLGGG
ncbi:hypothetical protein AXF42_Ash001973 [Apostasia shenzhenica]|uniref:Uncharacterized protein n=1 Tax=Apostasia shenzhenica TaxID=1088818 RepID=A0A2I0ABR3_9ASPA|nr:hypothetical protein AXF42_Ash001973 [Apostasia shenzhenica]